jgi:hypothetical protein
LAQLTSVRLELPNTHDNLPERKNNKSTWEKLFDTKSGNKLHKRTKSTPGNTHVPHQLDPIIEVGESGETQANLTSSNTSSRKPVGENPQCSTNRQANGDDVSILTTCTAIIQQANLQGVSEGNTRDAVINDEIAAIDGQNCTSNPSTHLSSGNSNTTEDEYPSKEESDNTSDGYGASLARCELLTSQREPIVALQKEITLQTEIAVQERIAL